ncbi:MAG: efflux RND transporter periplasmic adaptor subunit [Endozoicomonas sp. (ex Botrylloides leachii)]|nr:efflux RND transporter periplasmic adaptor subunit [Endozoicomonas sp. (ex Botrylloides leachii)]
METIIILSYVALCIIVFRVFKVPITKWTVTTAFIIGMFIVGWIFLYMAMYQPVSRVARVYAITTPITSQVTGIVTKVYVKGNEPLKKGDPLYKIDDTPYIAKLKQTRAEIKTYTADINYLKKEMKRYEELRKKNYASQEQIDSIYKQLRNAEESLRHAQAEEKVAQFNLDSTVVRAPTDGYATQVVLKPGMKSRITPFQGNVAFVSSQGKQIWAAFPQAPARYIKPGYKAEVTFATIPGHAFFAKVVQVNDIFAQGALSPTATLSRPEVDKSPGRILVKVKLTDPELLKNMPLPAGTTAHVAVYSPEWEIFAIIRKVILRMQSWENWLFHG